MDDHWPFCHDFALLGRDKIQKGRSNQSSYRGRSCIRTARKYLYGCVKSKFDQQDVEISPFYGNCHDHDGYLQFVGTAWLAVSYVQSNLGSGFGHDDDLADSWDRYSFTRRDWKIERLVLSLIHIWISAGSLNGLYYVSNQIGKAAELNLNYVRDSRYMGMSHLAKEKSFFNFDFVFQDIFNELIPFDFDAFQRSDIQFWAGVTNCATGKIEFIEKRQQDDFLNVCRASSSIPILCSPVEIDGQYYVDGGVACAIPLFEDLPFHADRLVLVLTRHKGYRKSSVPEPLQKFYRHHFKNAPGMIDRLVTAPLRYKDVYKRQTISFEQISIFFLSM